MCLLVITVPVGAIMTHIKEPTIRDQKDIRYQLVFLRYMAFTAVVLYDAVTLQDKK